MTLDIRNIKLTNSTTDDYGPSIDFTADYFDDETSETYTLLITYRPTADNVELHELHFEISGDLYSSEIDTIADSQYFDDDTIDFIVSTARSLNL